MDLILKSYQCRQSLLAWREEFRAQVGCCTHMSPNYKHREILGASLAMQCILQRLIVALEPLHVGAADLEHETQTLAERVLTLSEEARADENPRKDIYLVQKRLIASSVIDSKQTWLQAVEKHGGAVREGGGHIRREHFKQWCDLFRRRA